MLQRRPVHLRLRFLQGWLQVCQIGNVPVISFVVLERHRTVNEVDALHVLLLESLVQHLEFDFLALTTLVWLG